MIRGVLTDLLEDEWQKADPERGPSAGPRSMPRYGLLGEGVVAPRRIVTCNGMAKSASMGYASGS